MEVGFFCFGVGVVLQGFQILGLDKKLKINYKRFCPEPKFETLAALALFDFLWCLEVFSMQKLVFSCFGNGKHLKKTMQILPSALAVAKASVWFFDLFALPFWLLFWVLMLHLSLNRKAWSLNNFVRNSKSISNQKAITTSYSDKSKNHTLAGQFYLLRVLESVQYSDFSVQLFLRWKHLQKIMQILPL